MRMLGALSNLFTISWYSQKVCSCKYTRTEVNISENPLLVKMCHFSAQKMCLSKRKSIDFILNRCSEALMSWKCLCMCKMHGCCMGGEAFSSLLYIQITSNQGFVSHVSCCFCCHQRQKTFQILFFAHRNSPKTQVHFLSPLLSLSHSLSGYIFLFLMAKTEERNKENHRIFYLI